MSSANIDAIQARYKASFSEKKMMIDGYRSQLLDESNNLSHLCEEIHGELHKLAGSLGMYGYDDLAVQARLAMRLSLTQEKESLDESLERLSLLFVE